MRAHDPRLFMNERQSIANRLLLALLALILSSIGVWWISEQREAAQPSAQLEQTPPLPAVDRSAIEHPLVQQDELAREEPAARPARTRPASSDGAARADGQRFQGKGVIRGHIDAAQGVVFPQSWTLIVEPSALLVGRERAVERRIDFTHGERDFRVEDLPLGGYQIRAQAAGLNNRACSVLLVQASADQFVTTSFAPSGFLDGIVLDAHEAPAEGVLVTAERTDTHARQAATSDATGMFIVRDLIDGPYHIYLGSPDSPLVVPDTIEFRAPTLRLPTHKLPATGMLRVETYDTRLRPLGGVHVSGFANPGSSLEIETDPNGEALVRHLLPGFYRLRGRVEDGREGQAMVQVEADQDVLATIRVLNPSTR